MMNCRIMLPLILLLCLTLSGCAHNRQAVQLPEASAGQTDYSQLDLAEQFEDLGGLTAASPLIVEALLTENSSKVAYAGANFIINELTVTDVIKGNASAMGQTLQLLELESLNINLTKTSDRFILFLDRYEGPVIEDEAYVISGVYQGRFDIGEDDKVRYAAGERGGLSTFQGQITPAGVEEFKEQIIQSFR